MKNFHEKITFKYERGKRADRRVQWNEKKTWWTKNDNRHSNETHHESRKMGSASNEFFMRAKEMQESWFWHDFRDFWIFEAIANRTNRNHFSISSNELGKCDAIYVLSAGKTAKMGLLFSCVSFNSNNVRHIKDEIKIEWTKGRRRGAQKNIRRRRQNASETRSLFYLCKRIKKKLSTMKENEKQKQNEIRKICLFKEIFCVWARMRENEERKKEKRVEVDCNSCKWESTNYLATFRWETETIPRFPWVWARSRCFNQIRIR